MLREFRDFVIRGNVVDLAVGFVAGAAFTALVNSLVETIINPLIAFLIGEPDFSSALMVELPQLPWADQSATLAFGALLTTAITFLGTMAGVFFFIVKPINAMTARRNGGTSSGDDDGPAQRECPECLSEVPARARRCRYCATALDPVA